MLFARRALSKNAAIFKARPLVPRACTSRSSWNLVSRRGYASGGHDEHKSSSDIPWAIGAVVVTAPACAYLWMNGTERAESHGHGDHSEHEEHGESDDGSHEGGDDQQQSGDEGQEEAKEDSEEQPKDGSKPEAQQDDKSDDKSDDSSSEEESGQDTPATSDDEADDKESEEGDKSNQGGSEGGSEEKPRWGKKNKGPLDAGQPVPTHAKHKGKPHEDGSVSKKAEGIHDTAKVLQPIDPTRAANPKPKGTESEP